MSAERMAEIEAGLRSQSPTSADVRWLLDRVREFEADAARLDWLERATRESFSGKATPTTTPRISVANSKHPSALGLYGKAIVIEHGWADEALGDTVRDAIDAARAATSS